MQNMFFVFSYECLGGLDYSPYTCTMGWTPAGGMSEIHISDGGYVILYSSVLMLVLIKISSCQLRLHI